MRNFGLAGYLTARLLPQAKAGFGECGSDHRRNCRVSLPNSQYKANARL
jgi:hypothetical protein